MYKNTATLILGQLLIFMTFLDVSLAIECYQCTGTNNKNPFQCNHLLPRDTNLVPEPCESVYDAKYCVKHSGRFEGGVGTKRFCSSLDLGNYCNYVNHPGDELTYRTCIHTCSGNGCNSSMSLLPMTIVTIISISLIAVLFKTTIR